MKRSWLVLSAALLLASAAPGAAQAQAGAGERDEMSMDEPGDSWASHQGGDMRDFKRFGAEKGGGPGLKQGAPDDQDSLDLIKKYDAGFAAKLAELRKAAPNKYRMLVRIFGRFASAARMENNEEMEKDVVRGFSLEYDTKELARGYEKAPDGDKAGIKKQLAAKVSELFDIRLKAQEARIGRMEKDLARLKKNLENRKANKAKIVGERIDQLTGEGYGW